MIATHRYIFKEDSSVYGFGPCRTKNLLFVGPLVHIHAIHLVDEAANFGLPQPVKISGLHQTAVGWGRADARRACIHVGAGDMEYINDFISRATSGLRDWG